MSVRRIRPQALYSLDKETIRMLNEMKNLGFGKNRSRIVDSAIRRLYNRYKKRGF